MHKSSWLRIIRICFSIVFLILTGLIFIDPSRWLSSHIINLISWLQFTPSLIKFTVAAGLAAGGFIITLLLTFFFGRLYCAGICPLGTLQDIIGWTHRHVFRQKPLKYAKPGNILRFSILILVLISFLAGTTFLISITDPYSTFGRIMSNLFRPLFFLGSNGLADLLEKRDIFLLSKTDYKGFFVIPAVYASGFLLIVGLMSWFRGRLYCNTICPVGAVLGLFSKFSIFRISLDKESCNSCGHCSRVCKAQCIDVKSREVDVTRCVTCFNCLTVCPSDGVNYNLSDIKRDVKIKENKSSGIEVRRNLLKAIFLFSAFISSRAFATRLTGGEKPTKNPEPKKLVSTPPGSESHELYNSLCTACHLCISVCPTQVLQPSFLQYGLLGFIQPYMDNHTGFCNFECDLCGQVCPTGAIKPLLPAQKKRIQIGVAQFIKENCVVYTDNTDCGACSEHCPTKAVNMVPYKGHLAIPEVNDKICIGCGACEYACPTKPYRAIFVEGNAVHKLADIPKQEKIKIKETTEDFPF
jgi:polyferredoxin